MLPCERRPSLHAEIGCRGAAPSAALSLTGCGLPTAALLLSRKACPARERKDSAEIPPPAAGPKADVTPPLGNTLGVRPNDFAPARDSGARPPPIEETAVGVAEAEEAAKGAEGRKADEARPEEVREGPRPAGAPKDEAGA